MEIPVIAALLTVMFDVALTVPAATVMVTLAVGLPLVEIAFTRPDVVTEALLILEEIQLTPDPESAFVLPSS